MAAKPSIVCPACRYDLRGIITADRIRCPECGETQLLSSLLPPTKWRLKGRYLPLAFFPSLSVPVLEMIDSHVQLLPEIWLIGAVVAIIWASIGIARGGRAWKTNRGEIVAYGFFLTILLAAFNIGMLYFIALAMMGLLHL